MRFVNHVLTAAFTCAMLLLPTGVQAGAWPRGSGQVFASTALFLSWPSGRGLNAPDVYLSSYAEYGVTDRATALLDFGTADMDDPARLRAVAALRYSFSPPDAVHQIAFDVGGGTKLNRAVVRLGASYGRGLKVLGRSGWISVDAASHFAPAEGRSSLGIDATFGASLDPTWSVMVQASGYRAFDGAAHAKLTPSAVYALSDRLKIELGAEFNVTTGADPVLKIGVWHSF